MAEGSQASLEALAIAENSLSRRHWYTIQLMKNLAVLVDLQGRTGESEDIVRAIQALENEDVFL